MVLGGPRGERPRGYLTTSAFAGQKKGSPSASFFFVLTTKNAILFLTLFAKQLNTTLGVKLIQGL
jgi:hypothetical protein